MIPSVRALQKNTQQTIVTSAPKAQDFCFVDFRNKRRGFLVQANGRIFNARMSGSYRKLFRESHRELRLKPWQPGHDGTFEVRPLSLTPHPSKIIRIKDTPEKSHER